MYKSYKKDVEKAMKHGYENGLIKVGLLMQRIGAEILTKFGHVDTGRLRASLTYVVGYKVGKLGRDKRGVKHSQDKPKGRVRDKELHVGTNVEYAAKIERLHSFIKNPVKLNIKKINEILNESMEEALK